MSPLIKIATRRMRKEAKKSFILMFSLLFCSLIIAFFCFFYLQIQITQNPDYSALPFTRFLNNVKRCMGTSAVFLAFTTFITLRIHCNLRERERAQTLAVLSSIGASGNQKRVLILSEAFFIYLPPILLGTILGAPMGISAGELFVGVEAYVDSSIPLYFSLFLCILFVLTAICIVCALLPSIEFKKRSLIRSVKARDSLTDEAQHGYRNSETFKRQRTPRRLARKSIDYYRSRYSRLALAFASAALYPVLAIFSLQSIGEVDIILDQNPYDFVYTTAAVIEAAEHVLIFIGLCFVMLTILGVIQAYLTARLQAEERKATSRIYLSLGMTENEIKRMIRFEFFWVCTKSLIYLAIATILAAFVY